VTGHIATLISDPAERKRRRQAKRDQVLRWLRLNTWSSADVLRQVAEQGSRQAAHTLLEGLCRDGLIRKGIIAAEFGSPVLIWGITAHGAAMAARENEPVAARTFEPSKVSASTLSHSLDVQLMQLKAERAGWKWQPIFGEFSRSEAKYADAVGMRPDGQKVAIELERTVKTVKRYAEILIAHLAARKDNKWEWIYYLSPDEVTCDRVRRAFQEISRARWRGRIIAIDDAHRAPFRFFSYNGNWI